MNLDKMLNETSEEIKKNWMRNEMAVKDRKLTIRHFGSIAEIYKMSEPQIVAKLNSLIKSDKLEYEDIEDMTNFLVDSKRLSSAAGEKVKDAAEKALGVSDEDLDMLRKKLDVKVKPNLKTMAFRVKNKLKGKK